MTMEKNKKFYLDINGRCGNQMFQYAFARKVMFLNNINDLHIDFYHVNRWKEKANGDNSYSDQLKYFNTIPYSSSISTGDSVRCFGSNAQKRLYKRYPVVRKISYHFNAVKMLQRYQRKLHKNGIYKEDEFKIELIKSKTGIIFARGYFEDPDIFKDMDEILFKEFTPKKPRREKNRQLYSIIDNEESVCVSFRVWNEIKYDEDFLAEHNICSKEYYVKAINKMHELHPNAHFIIFSNDIEWVKRNINFDYPVSFEDGNDEIWEKLRMMYSCKHFIMSNSTFCWWAQYLCRNKNKTVISPNKWCANGKSKLLMKEWIKISD